MLAWLRAQSTVKLPYSRQTVDGNCWEIRQSGPALVPVTLGLLWSVFGKPTSLSRVNKLQMDIHRILIWCTHLLATCRKEVRPCRAAETAALKGTYVCDDLSPPCLTFRVDSDSCDVEPTQARPLRFLVISEQGSFPFPQFTPMSQHTGM